MTSIGATRKPTTVILESIFAFSISFRYKRTVRDSIPGPQTWTVGYRKTHRHIGEREREGRHLKLHRRHHHHNHHRSFTSNSSWIHVVLTEACQIQSWLDVLASETLGQPVYLPDKSVVFNFLNYNFVNCDFYIFFYCNSLLCWFVEHECLILLLLKSIQCFGMKWFHLGLGEVGNWVIATSSWWFGMGLK